MAGSRYPALQYLYLGIPLKDEQEERDTVIKFNVYMPRLLEVGFRAIDQAEGWRKFLGRDAKAVDDCGGEATVATDVQGPAPVVVGERSPLASSSEGESLAQIGEEEKPAIYNCWLVIRKSGQSLDDIVVRRRGLGVW